MTLRLPARSLILRKASNEQMRRTALGLVSSSRECMARGDLAERSVRSTTNPSTLGKEV